MVIIHCQSPRKWQRYIMIRLGNTICSGKEVYLLPVHPAAGGHALPIFYPRTSALHKPQPLEKREKVK